MLRGINPGFPGLFPTRRKVVYVFRTRLPVASLCIATELLPHDLHVLSLPLAFILSQDQTLHCKCCLMLTLLIQRINVSNRIVFAFDLPIVSPEARRAVASQLSKIFWLPSLRLDGNPSRFEAYSASHFLGVQMYEPYYSQPKLF